MAQELTPQEKIAHYQTLNKNQYDVSSGMRETLRVPGNDSRTSLIERSIRNSAERGSLAWTISHSSLYIQAFELFASDLRYGERFKHLLEQIPDKYINASSTWYDDFLGSNKKQEADRLSLQAAMTDIENLVKSYYEFVNGLPSEQASQMAAIGHNYALGSGVDSSSLQMEKSSSPEFTSATASSDIVSGVVGAVNAIQSIFTASANIASLRKGREKVDFDMELAKRTFITNFSNYLRSAGYESAANEVLTSNFDSSIDIVRSIQADPTNKRRINKAIIDYMSTVGIDQKIIDKFTDDEFNLDYDSLLKLAMPGGQKLPSDIDKVIDSIMTYRIQSHVFQLKSNYFNSKYSADYSSALDGSNEGTAHNLEVDYKKRMYEYNVEEYKYKLDTLKRWINEYKETSDPIAKRCLMEAIMNISSDSLFMDQIQEIGGDLFDGDMTMDQFFSGLLLVLSR